MSREVLAMKYILANADSNPVGQHFKAGYDAAIEEVLVELNRQIDELDHTINPNPQIDIRLVVRNSIDEKFSRK